MRLDLFYDRTDEETANRLAVLDGRRYVVRALVPEGYETYFQERARFISAHTSTAIEGNPMTEEAAMLVLVEGANPNDPDSIEKVNLKEVYELTSELASDRTIKIDEGIIRTVNSMALKGLPDRQARTRGKYRVGQNLIVDAETGQVRYTPPSPERVPELMGGLISSIEQWMEEHPAPVAAALTHFGLISIHPFDDGNGRTARVIADMILDLKGWSIDGMLSTSGIILDRRAEYYGALRASQGPDFGEKIDATAFVRFHIDALTRAAVMLEDRVVLFNKRRDRLVRQLDFLNPRQVTGLMFMLDVGPVSSTAYARMTASSQATALTDLTELVNKKAAERVGAGRNTRYRLHPDLAQIANEAGTPSAGSE